MPETITTTELLENLNTKFLGLPPLPPWQEAVERYVERLRADPTFK